MLLTIAKVGLVFCMTAQPDSVDVPAALYKNAEIAAFGVEVLAVKKTALKKDELMVGFQPIKNIDFGGVLGTAGCIDSNIFE